MTPSRTSDANGSWSESVHSVTSSPAPRKERPSQREGGSEGNAARAGACTTALGLPAAEPDGDALELAAGDGAGRFCADLDAEELLRAELLLLLPLLPLLLLLLLRPPHLLRALLQLLRRLLLRRLLLRRLLLRLLLRRLLLRRLLLLLPLLLVLLPLLLGLEAARTVVVAAAA